MKGNEVRSRCVLKDFATTVRDDVVAPSPSPLSVRGLLLYAAWFDLRVETGDLVCDFMQADTSSETYARPPKGQERDGWIWIHGAMNGLRTASCDFTEFLAGVPTEHMGFKRGKLERCLFVHESNETHVVSHVDDPLICAKPATLEKFWMQITKMVVIKRGDALNPRCTCGVLGIRVPKCTRSWTQRFHSETYRQVRGRMLGHFSIAERKGSNDAFDGTEEHAFAR